MTNLNAMTTDYLLMHTHKILNVKNMSTNYTQECIDRLNQELIEIDAELDLRQPMGEFRTLHQKVTIKNPYSAVSYFSFCLEPIGFEYLGTCSCGRAQKDCTFPYCEA